MISRRRLLQLGLVAGGVTALRGRRALAIGPGSKFRIGHLILATGNSDPRPTALRRMLWEVDKRTSIDVDLQPKTIYLERDSLHETPFLYLSGDREFEVPSPAAITRLRRFLTFGGFLLIDSAEGSAEGAFDRSVRRLMETLYPAPSKGLELVPGDHVVYKSFYLIERPFGRVATSPITEGVLRDGRLSVAYIQNDLGGAWARDNFGNYEFQCVPGGARQRELAFRMGVNVVMYALCLDYKSDQVHVEFIMRRRRWRPDDGAQPPDDTVHLPPRKPK
ncbi:MAG TPA: DUF4159 domain-containing protein [Kofleriaceae bacterium]|nr:DUF4159 domain-containing protein [Kofleriaceae bacterium]